MSYFRFPKYVSVAEKRARAEKKIRQLKKKNPDLAPVIIEGRTLAQTWWGKSWNRNLERYADYSNRIERGRSYVRHLAVLDLKIDKGAVAALVQGSQRAPYTVEIKIKALPKSNWGAITAACAQQLDSLQDLLAGRFPESLAHLFMQKDSGLFPSPKEIEFACSCPDWAYMCKHVAAVLYGIGARLDEDPALFFLLRQVNMNDLISKAIEDTTAQWIQNAEANETPTIAEADLGNLFGIDMDAVPDLGNLETDVSAKPKLSGKPSQKARATRQPAPTMVSERQQIIELVNTATDGITAVELHHQSSIGIVKIRNVLYQAYHNGEVEKVSRGVYRAKHSRAKAPTTPGQRREAVLKCIDTAHKGIRTPQVAEGTGLAPAAVRPILIRLLNDGAIRRMSRGVYGPLDRTHQKTVPSTTAAIFKLIKNHPKGIGAAALIKQSGCEEKRLRNVLFRLHQKGRIRRIARGTYVAAAGKKQKKA
ncbi:hypothetical protein DSCO28_41220 [Desulfosarcina ovata subsp. sediminis]|uniref:SWIM-type domain-containing protein n=1 Tax=Desulfosarcina ovata subsp. sediminis TaxID=885957 RepID=A0A5K7ZTJ5_9BACT|nr:hypothetical protein [Desulfosarcina ovata]BBO83556.1 hypothetical protein DSCO28_41220 [Desulfosarcina ovata subsp. sediminis]